jgi:hypothetical protein
MSMWTTYEHSEKGRHKAVKQGFSWTAFFFNVIWALTKGLWVQCIGGMAILVFFGTLGHGDNPFPSIIIAVVFGAYGNNWWGSSLRHRGYVRTGQHSA